MKANQNPESRIAMPIRKLNAAILSGAFAFLIGAATTQGQVTGTWNSTVASNPWATVTNWTNSDMPGSNADDTAVFDNTITTGAKTATLPTATLTTLGTLNFQGSNGTLNTSITGGQLFFDSTSGTSAINFNGSQTLITITSTINLANDLQINANGSAATALTFSTGTFNANGNDIYINLDNALSKLTFSGGITGDGSNLIKSGDGLLTINTRAATYTGATTLLSGSTTLGIAQAIASSTSVFIDADATLFTSNLAQTLNNLSGAGRLYGTAALTFANSDNTTFTGSVSGATLTKTGTGSLTLSGTNYFSGAASINGGTLALIQTGTMRTTNLTIGTAATDDGSVVLSDDAQWTAAGTVIVGSSGTGTLDISDDAKLLSTGAATIGSAANSNGAVTVSDSGTWTTGALTVGSSGTGTLDISDDARVTTTGAGAIGNTVTGNGAVTLSDSGTWTMTTTLVVGGSGVGSLDISGSARVATGATSTAIVGNGANSKGSVIISNSGTLTSGALTVGNSGTGSLDISGSAGVTTTGAGVIGGVRGSGSVSVRDSGTWTLTGALTVASGGTSTGNLDISGNAAVISSGNATGAAAIIGRDLASKGSVTLSDEAYWKTGNLTIGSSGTGTLDVSGTSRIDTTGFGTIGGQVNSSGSVSLSDSGTWTLTGALTIAYGGTSTGSLDISGSAAVITTAATAANGAAIIGRDLASKGAVMVSDAASWTTGNLTVGNSGTGILDISGTGKVTSTGVGTIGSAATGVGRVTVSGSSEWSTTAATALTIGYDGNGSLEISDAGKVTSAGAVNMGARGGAASTGNAIVSGTAGEWTIGGILTVGSGTLEIKEGGTVTQTAGAVNTLGSQSNKTASAIVSGSGSWINNGLTFAHAASSTATFDVSENASVTSNGAVTLSNNASANARAAISGNAQWETGNLTIAAGGTASLDISDTASVTTNGNVIIGSAANSNASVTVGDSGTWTAAGAFTVAVNGTGSLIVSDSATVTTSGSIIVGSAAAGRGVVTLTGNDTDGRGTLETTAIVKGHASASGTLAFDGGILRATDTSTNFIGNTLAVAIGAGGAFIDSNGSDIATSATLTGAGALTKQGLGSLTLGSSSTIGSVNVAAGTLAHTHTGTFATTGDYVIANNAAASLGATAYLDVGGAFTQSGTLSLFTSLVDSPAIFAQSATIASTAWLNFDTLKASQAMYAFIQTTSGTVDGNYAADRIIIGGETLASILGGSIPDYYYQLSSPTVSPDGKAITLGGGLSWNDPDPAAAHGTFTVADGDPFADIDVVLADRTSITNPAWDGKTLTKDGDGTLTLSATNTYTGSTVINDGAIAAGAANIFAESDQIYIAATGTLSTGIYSQTAQHLTGEGVLDLGTAGIFTAYNTVTSTFGGVITGGASTDFTKTGEGTLELTNSGTAGRLYANGGQLILSSTIHVIRSGNTGTNLTDAGANSTIGNLAIGKLTVQDGGLLYATNQRLIVGNGSGAHGTLDVSGMNSRVSFGYSTVLAPNYSVMIGTNAGTGVANITDGGRLEAGFMTVGWRDAASSGTLNVEGPGSSVSTILDLQIGQYGSGFLNIKDGATVTVGRQFLSGYDAAARSTVVIDGVGSQLISTNVISSYNYDYIGYAGKATMEVINGGRFLTKSLAVGFEANSSGHLIASNGGVVDVNGSLLIGYSSNSTGTMTITNSGTVIVRPSSAVYVGNTPGGKGVLNISNGGVLETGFIYRGNNAVASGTVNFDGGVLRALATTTNFIRYFKANELNIMAGGAIIDTQSYNVGTNTNDFIAFYGVGGLTKIGTGMLTLNAEQKYTGTTTVQAGTLRLDEVNIIGSSTAVAVNATLDMYGYDQTIKNLSGTTTGRILTQTGVLFGDLTIDNNEATHYAGIITGNGAMIKTGTGTLTLSGSNSYTGNTTINAGDLNLRGYIASATTAINAGGNLVGTGTIAGLVTVASSATLSPGDLTTTGTLTIQNGLSLANGSILNFKLGTPDVADAPDGTSDLINVTGDLSITGTASLHVTAQTGFGMGVYRLINYTGTLALNDGGTISFDSLTGSSLLTDDFMVDLSVTKQVNLVQGASDILFWDGELTAGNGKVEGGNGVWNTGTTPDGTLNWTGTTGTPNKIWNEGKFAVFGYGPDALPGGTVTVDNTLGDVTLNGAQFLVNDYVLEGGVLTFTGTSGTAAILVGAGDTSDSAITTTINTRLTGTADLHKIYGGTLVLGGSNTYTGTTVVEGGALKLTHYAATGTGNVTLAADTALELAFGGTYANSIAGDATNTVTISGSDVTLAATGAAHTFSGTWQIVNGGTASISAEANLGAATATVDIAAGGWLTTSDTTFSRTLSGTGVLAASLTDSSGTFAFANGVNTTGFNGTLDLQSGYLALDAANTNVAALSNATLRVSSAGVAEVLSDATIGSLTLNGGVLKIAAAAGSNINQFSGTLTVGALDLAATSTLAIGLTGTLNTAIDPHSNFFSDSGSATRYQLHVVKSSTLLGSAGNITLTNYDGSAIGSPEFAQNVTINDGGISGTAVYNYRASGSNDGLYVGYGLSQLIANTGTQILLSNAGATSDTLDAALTGDGGYKFAITGTALVGNAGSDYLGATHITSGTVIFISSTALGKTSLLDIAANAAADLAGYSQTIGAFSGSTSSTLALSNGTLVITDGGISEGTLTGTGSLILNGGLFDVRSANTNLTATATIAATGTARLDNTDGLGSTGLIANAGLLEFNAAKGTLTKSIAGTGTVALANSATVTLSADNTGLDGVFDIAAGSQLIATAQNQLADADLAIAGIFTASNAALITLGADNVISGNGQIVKTGSGELLITSSNAFNGTTAITGGTLTLANLFGTGTGAVSNNAILNLADSGTYANTISGSGVNLVSGNVSLRGDNTAFTGTLSVTGTADIDNNNQIGDETTAKVVIASNAKLATTATSFVHALNGDGVLAANTGTTFDFMGDKVGTAFTGTVALTNSTLTLGVNKNTDVLVNAALQLNAGSALHANNETEKIKALDLNGGALWLKMNGVQPDQVLKVGTLAVSNTTASTVVFENYATGSVAMVASATNKNFLDQDNITNNATLLVEADALDDPTQRKIAIEQADGTALSNGQIVDYGNVHAIYDYTALTDSGTNAAAYTGTAGLYYDYVLTALDVQTGTTLELTTVGATDNTLLADIIGLGSVIYTAPDGSITLSGSNSYSGTSTITTGTVIAAAHNVLGAAAPLDINDDGAFDLGAYTQTITTITTASTSLLNVNSGSLAINNGGTIAGALAGNNTGTLHIAGGTLDITSASADFAASTTIAANATARLTNPAGLGIADIALSGTLHLDIAAADSGTLANALSGDGVFSKTNTGDVTLTASGVDFHGTGTIAAGRVIATRTDNLGNATISLDAAATYEMRDIAAGTLANTLRGSGTFALTRSDILVNRVNAIANTLTVALDQPSNLRLGVTGISLGAVHMNSGTITFATATGSATIATLGHSTGNFVFNADLSAATAGINAAGTIANSLTITDGSSGRHNIYVNATGEPTVINTAIELVTVENGTAQFGLANPGGKLEYALTTLELLQGDGSVYIPDSRKWYLTDAGLSHAADAILNTASTLALDWNYSLDSLHLRMGEIRSLHAASVASAEGNIWMRARGYRMDATNELSGLDFHQYAWGMSIGVDKNLALAGGQLTVGGMLDMGNIDRKFDNSGTGDTNNIGVALYATYLWQKGWFADAVVKIDRYDHEFDARAYNGGITHGEYSNKSIGLSIEAGKRIEQSNGWWYEPALQVSMLWLNSADYSTVATDVQRAIDVSVNDTTNFQYRAIFRAGRQIKNTAWYPYGKLAAAWVESTGGGIRAHGKKYHADYDGFRGEAGVGIMYRINEVSQVYFDYEYANASNYDRPWSFNLGYRRLW